MPAPFVCAPPQPAVGRQSDPRRLLGDTAKLRSAPSLLPETSRVKDAHSPEVDDLERTV